MSKEVTLTTQLGITTATGLRNAIEELVVHLSYTLVSSKQILRYQELSTPCYATLVDVGKTIYGKQRKSDFVLFHPKHFPQLLVLECKWQSSVGTVDEKYPYLVHNVAHTKLDTIIILDGGGYSPGAKQWLEKQSGKNHLVDVLSIKDFLSYMHKHHGEHQQ